MPRSAEWRCVSTSALTVGVFKFTNMKQKRPVMNLTGRTLEPLLLERVPQLIMRGSLPNSDRDWLELIEQETNRGRKNNTNSDENPQRDFAWSISKQSPAREASGNATDDNGFHQNTDSIFPFASNAGK